MSMNAVPEVPRVLALLTDYGIRQADLVQRLGVPKSTISMWFRGKRAIPTAYIDDLWALAAFARMAIDAVGNGREALLIWTPSTHGQRPPYESLENYEFCCIKEGQEFMLRHWTPDPSTFVDNAISVEDTRQGYRRVHEGLAARLQRLAQRPLPLSE
jgi:transcriptional regulator with XRE-family HTH domain